MLILKKFTKIILLFGLYFIQLQAEIISCNNFCTDGIEKLYTTSEYQKRNFGQINQTCDPTQLMSSSTSCYYRLFQDDPNMEAWFNYYLPLKGQKTTTCYSTKVMVADKNYTKIKVDTTIEDIFYERIVGIAPYYFIDQLRETYRFPVTVDYVYENYVCEKPRECNETSEPEPPTPENNSTKWKIIDSYSCSGTENTLVDECNDKNAKNIKVLTWNSACCGQNAKCYKSECQESDTEFPTLAENQRELFRWQEDEDKSQECKDNDGEVQSHIANCKKEYRCVQETQSCPIEDDIPISSYVSPSNKSFHEDIEITGVSFVLHYSSVDLNDSDIAHGWHISSHARLVGDKVCFGIGKIIKIDTSIKEDNLTIITLGSTQWLFDNQGLLQTIRELHTKEIKQSFIYKNRRLISIKNSVGEISSLNRDSEGKLLSISSPFGQKTYISIDNNNDLVEIQYEDSASYIFEYENHLMTKEIEPKGNEFLHFFDINGNIIKVIDAEAGEWNFTSIVSQDNLSQIIKRASNNMVTYKRHILKDGILKSEKTLPSGDNILYENAIDDTTSIIQSCGMKRVNIYKENNGTLYKNPYTNRRELQTTTTSTASGLTKINDYNKTYVLDKNGKLNTIKRNSSLNGKVSTIKQDFKHHKVVYLTPDGKKSILQYDKKMQKLLYSKPYGLNKTKYFYDDKNRLIKEKTDKRVIKYSYDNYGNLKQIINPKKQTTLYGYDSRNRLTSITYPNGHSSHFNYDANGNIITLTTPTPTNHNFEYNGVNRRTSLTSPLQYSTTYLYDKARRVIKTTKPSGKTIAYNYDKDRLSDLITDEASTFYNYSCQNLLSQISKGDEKIQLSYDGTLLTSMIYSGILNETIDYKYNNDFIVEQMTYAGKNIAYTYNKDNELLSSGAFKIERSQKNRLIEISDNNFKLTTKYNHYGELKEQKNKLFSFELKRDKNGQIIEKREKIKHEKIKYKYSYDKRNRLIEVRKNNKVVESYQYDKNSNRVSAKIKGKKLIANYTLDDNIVVYGDNSYSYDTDGYLQEKTTPNGTTTYEYGTLGELKSVTSPTKTISYQHNASNQRVAKKVNGIVVEKYLWANLTTLLAIYDKNSNLLQRFDYADSRMPISMTMGADKYYLHYDQVGSLRAVSDSSHNIIKEIVYDTFGNILSDSNEAFKVPFGFAGGLYDSDTKLTRFGYRDYDAYTGKWTAKDPIGFGGGDSNLYGYVLGDPVNWIDEDGLSKTKGILKGDDPYLQQLKKANGNRQEISVIEKEIQDLKNSGKLNSSRWNKLKGWIKLAKDGRLYTTLDWIGELLELEIREMTNCGWDIPLEECVKRISCPTGNAV